MIVTTHGQPDVDRALLMVQLADSIHIAVLDERGDLRQAGVAHRRVMTSMANLSETCQAAGVALRVSSYSAA